MSSVLRVEGGHPLRGEITVRGAKNFVPKAMVASLLATTSTRIFWAAAAWTGPVAPGPGRGCIPSRPGCVPGAAIPLPASAPGLCS